MLKGDPEAKKNKIAIGSNGSQECPVNMFLRKATIINLAGKRPSGDPELSYHVAWPASTRVH